MVSRIISTQSKLSLYLRGCEKPQYGKEFAKWGLRRSTKPGRGLTIATSVHVAEEDKSYLCYVRYQEPFIEAVGKAMPMGVSSHDKVYLFVDVFNGSWFLWSVYVDRRDCRKLLVVYDSRPSWLCTHSMERKCA